MTNSTNDDLEKLAQARDNILLATLGAFLHNLGKLSKAFLAYQRCKACTNSDPPLSPDTQDVIYENFKYQAITGLVADFVTDPNSPTLSREELNRLKRNAEDWLEVAYTNNILPENFMQFLQERKISLAVPLNDRPVDCWYSIGDFIEFQSYKWYEPISTGQQINIMFPSGSKATELLEISHDAASGTEKEGSEKKHGLQPQSPTYLATLFGYEAAIDEEKIETVRQTFLDELLNAKQNYVLDSARNQLILGLGDTRRTINDVTLWDISASVASFYKAAVARLLIDEQWVPRGDFTWRLLRISYDGLAFLERAPTIGDMLGRQAALTDALNQVRHLLEYEYPLGNEVYRDENGSAFVVPALDGDDNNGTQLRGLIESYIMKRFRESNLQGEVVPHIRISEASKKARELHTLLQEQPPQPSPFPDAIQCWWQGKSADICTACGMRPQGWGAPNDKKKQKAEDRNVCYVCLERRENRSKAWANGRETTASEEQKQLWQHTIWVDEVADKNGRLALIVGHFNLDDWLAGTMIQTMLVVCDPANQDVNKRYVSKNPSFARIQRVWRTTHQFWQDVWNEDMLPTVPSTDSKYQKHARLEINVRNANELNVGYYHAYDAEIDGKRLSVVWDSDKKCFITADNLTPWGGAEALQAQLKDMGTLTLSEMGGYGKQRSPLPSAGIQSVKCMEATYTPAVKLLAEPRSFMALVPANKAVEVAEKIRQRYEREMSKVRNRLPMHLGIVFFGRRQPLFSVLDAGRRMLDIQISPENCLVESNNGYCDLAPKPPQLHFKQYTICLKTQQEEILTWRVSTVMGDGQTEDEWYPYVAVDTNANGNAVAGRKQFPHNNQQWVHATELQVGDTVQFTPARFSYLFLDTSARRFDVGKSESLLPLEELERMQIMWNKLCAIPDMSESRLHAVVTLLTMKRDEWGEESQAYTQLIKTVFTNEQLGSLLVKGKEKNIAQRLLRTFELYQQILKKRLKKD